jgi:hypothetical protein
MSLFVAKRTWQIYCSKSCSMKAKYIRDRIKEKPKYDQYKADLWRFYKLTLEDYNLMVEKQKGCCKICGKHVSSLKGKKTRLCVDHCHTTGKVRGLLCEPCNTLLGMAKDDTRTLQSAIAYLMEK